MHCFAARCLAYKPKAAVQAAQDFKDFIAWETAVQQRPQKQAAQDREYDAAVAKAKDTRAAQDRKYDAAVKAAGAKVCAHLGRPCDHHIAANAANAVR